MALVVGMRRDAFLVAFADVCDDPVSLRIVERACIPATVRSRPSKHFAKVDVDVKLTAMHALCHVARTIRAKTSNAGGTCRKDDLGPSRRATSRRWRWYTARAHPSDALRQGRQGTCLWRVCIGS